MTSQAKNGTIEVGGDVTLMTNDDNKKRKNFTLRLNAELNDKVKKEAEGLGLTQTQYITMVLHKVLRDGKVS